MELHRIDALAVGIVPQFHLGLCIVLHIEIGLRRDRLADVAKSGALTADGVRQSPLVVDDGRRTHQKGVDAVRKLDARKIGRLLNVLTEQRDGARHVGRRHGGTAVNAVAAHNGGRDLAAMRSDLGLDLQVGRRSPRREVGHERARLIVLVEVDGARPKRDERTANVRRDRAGGNLLARSEGRDDTSRLIVVDDTADCAVFIRNALFFLEIGLTARDDRNAVALRKRAAHSRGIVVCPAVAGNDDKVERAVLIVAEEFLDKVALFARGIARLVEVDCRAVGKLHIGGLLSGNGGNGKRARVCRGRTDRAAVGIGRQIGSTVCAVLRRASGVGRCDDEVDPRFVHFIVNFIDSSLINLTRKARRDTQRHVDDVCAQRDAVGDGCKNIVRLRAAFRAVLQIGEDLADHELRIGRNADESLTVFKGFTIIRRHILVFARDDARDVVSVRGSLGENIGIVVRIVICEGNFGIVIDVIHRNGAALRARRKVVHIGFHFLFRELFRSLGGHFPECGVISVISRIEYGDQHPVALIFDLGRIVNTRIVHIDDVFRDRRLRDRIDFRIDDVLDARQRRDR